MRLPAALFSIALACYGQLPRPGAASGGGAGAVGVALDGIRAGAQAEINFVSGGPFSWLVTDTGARINVQGHLALLAEDVIPIWVGTCDATTFLRADGTCATPPVARPIGYVFDGGGSPLTAGATRYFTVPFACTISAWNMTVDAGTATVDVWKIATGTAIPTIANTITAAATPAIAANTARHSTTLTAWTTAVAANDIFGFNLKAVTSATTVSLVLECDQ